MPPPAVAVVIVLSVIAAGILVWRYCARRRSRGGFRDWVLNPDYRQSAKAYFAARNALEVPEDLSDDDIQRMVERLFVERDEDFNFEMLRLIGARAIPFLIAALDEERTWRERFSGSRHAFEAKSPFQRLCDLLEPHGASAAVRPLARYVEHEDEGFRRSAALVLGAIGNADCIDLVRKLLSDDDALVRSFTMRAIQRGATDGRLTADFVDTVFPEIARNLDSDDRLVAGNVPEILLAVDETRARELLLSPRYFTLEYGEVWSVIDAFNKAVCKIPHALLLPFLRQAKPAAGSDMHEWIYAAALTAYAIHPDAETEHTLREALDSSNKDIRRSAAEGLTILHGIGKARDVAYEAMFSLGFGALTAPQQIYCAVDGYDGEVNNGGHTQFFVNSSGSLWKRALEGLHAVGAEEKFGILREAAHMFGPSGPPEDDDLRYEQLSQFSEQQLEQLSEFDDRYGACEEDIPTLLALYAIDHKDHFLEARD